jgi:AraC family transcriptional regulator
MARHAHLEGLMSIVVRGRFLEQVGNRTRDYARGQFAYLPAGMEHAQTFGPQGARQVIFRAEPRWLEYLSDCRTPLAEAPCSNAPEFRALGDRLLREMGSTDTGSALAREGLILELISAFGRCHASGRVGTAPAWLRATREFLDEHPLSTPSMSEVAELAGRHEVHVAREFRRYFGVSMGSYVRRLRAAHVARLLLRPRRGIADIALECGYSSHAHLCRDFKVHFGVTPSEYRRGAR